MWKQAMDLKDASVNSLYFSLRIHCVPGVTFYGSEQRENANITQRFLFVNTRFSNL
jgi:hypothetical protein